MELELLFETGAHQVEDLLWHLDATVELSRTIEDESLKPEETKVFVETAFRDGAIQSSGTAVTRILPPVSRFAPTGGHGEKKKRVLKKLGEFFERFFGLSNQERID